jgi:hypothetical protein
MFAHQPSSHLFCWLLPQQTTCCRERLPFSAVSAIQSLTLMLSDSTEGVCCCVKQQLLCCVLLQVGSFLGLMSDRGRGSVASYVGNVVYNIVALGLMAMVGGTAQLLLAI